MPVEMQLTRIIMSEIYARQLIYLREVDGERQFPIVIGEFEAASIDRRVRGGETPRPLTHDLLINSVEELGGELDSILIDNLEDGIYYAKLRMRRGGDWLEVDSRPSDAIAVAVACDPPLPIYVAEDVLQDAMDQPLA